MKIYCNDRWHNVPDALLIMTEAWIEEGNHSHQTVLDLVDACKTLFSERADLECERNRMKQLLQEVSEHLHDPAHDSIIPWEMQDRIDAIIKPKGKTNESVNNATS